MADIDDKPPSSEPRALGISLIVSRIFEAIDNEEEECQKAIDGAVWYLHPSDRREKNDTLAACARVNRLWYGEAVKVLYGTMPMPLYAMRRPKRPNSQSGHTERDGQNGQDGDGEHHTRDDEFQRMERARDYENRLHRLPLKRRQFIANKIHTLELFVTPKLGGRSRLIYAEMLSRLEFPRLRCLKLKGVSEPLLGISPLPRETELPETPNLDQLMASMQRRHLLNTRRSEMKAYKALFLSQNLVHLDLSEEYALGYALELWRLNPPLVRDLLSRLTALSLRVTSDDHPTDLAILQYCGRLNRLELFDVAEIFPRRSTFAAIMAIVFIKSSSLESLRIGRCRERDYMPETHPGWPCSPIPPRPRLRELDFEGSAHWGNLLVQHVDPSIMESLRLELYMKGAETMNLDHLTNRCFSKLKHLSITRSPSCLRMSNPEDLDHLKPWIIPPKRLLSIFEGTPNLTHLSIDTIVDEGTWPYHVVVDIDDKFLSTLGDLLPNLEHINIKNNPNNTKWTSAGLIALGQRCRYLTHFDVGGFVDITDPVFENTLLRSGFVSDNDSPLFPCLRMLAITSRMPRSELADEYPAEAYPRAPPDVIARMYRLLAGHFPYLTSLTRFETESQLQMELRRKWATLDWPRNRLSHFISPWYVRLERRQVNWKFETRRRDKEHVESRDSDSNSNIDSEDGKGAYETDFLWGVSDPEFDEMQNLGAPLRQSSAPVATE